MIATTENRILMVQARESLKGKWGLAVGTYFIFMLITLGVEYIPDVGRVIAFIIGGPMSLGLAIFALSLSRKQEATLNQLFGGFQKFWVAFGAYLLAMLFIVLWALLLIIPGIIAALKYSQIFYIIAEDDSIGPLQAISKSKEMMEGNKGKLFLLVLQFFGLALLCLFITLGIGFLWLGPYVIVTLAKFYEDIKKNESTEEMPDNENTVTI